MVWLGWLVCFSFLRSSCSVLENFRSSVKIAPLFISWTLSSLSLFLGLLQSFTTAFMTKFVPTNMFQLHLGFEVPPPHWIGKALNGFSVFVKKNVFWLLISEEETEGRLSWWQTIVKRQEALMEPENKLDGKIDLELENSVSVIHERLYILTY